MSTQRSKRGISQGNDTIGSGKVQQNMNKKLIINFRQPLEESNQQQQFKSITKHLIERQPQLRYENSSAPSNKIKNLQLASVLQEKQFLSSKTTRNMQSSKINYITIERSNKNLNNFAHLYHNNGMQIDQINQFVYSLRQSPLSSRRQTPAALNPPSCSNFTSNPTGIKNTIDLQLKNNKQSNLIVYDYMIRKRIGSTVSCDQINYEINLRDYNKNCDNKYNILEQQWNSIPYRQKKIMPKIVNQSFDQIKEIKDADLKQKNTPKRQSIRKLNLGSKYGEYVLDGIINYPKYSDNLPRKDYQVLRELSKTAQGNIDISTLKWQLSLKI